MLYTVQDTTMTALGDAIRSKVIGENPVVIFPEQYIDYNTVYQCQLPNLVKKIKLIGTGIYNKSVKEGDACQGVGIAPVLTPSAITTRKLDSYSVIYSFDINTIYDEKYFDFEVIIDSNCFTLVTSGNYDGYISYNLTYTAIGLDENGNEFKYTPAEMVETINGLIILPEEALNITGDCQYRFAYGGWDWLINQYGDKITTKDISNANFMFSETPLKTIPFDINIASNISDISNTFNHSKLEVVPYIIGPEKNPPTSSYSGILNMGSLFSNCQRLRYIPEDYFWKIVPNKDFWEIQANKSSQGQSSLFNYCYSLRKLPDISMIGGNWTSAYSCIYYNMLQFCYSLDEAINIPVYGTFTSNAMSNLFYSNNRLKEFMFLMNEDGTPKTANWKNQTIDFTAKGTFGYGSQAGISYNSGITVDKEVIDDATYQALKDDPDWFTADINYSRYNHDSAVNTINSLPDTSAYGTNTIKFMGAAGALTDGGAINTLTEEEIAVATAKSWTVSLV